METDKVDMSPEAIALRLQKMSELRELLLALKRIGQEANLHNNDIASDIYEKYYPRE